MKKLYLFAAAACFGLIFTFSSLLYAKVDLGIENLDVTPWGEVKLQYDDNVFLSKDDEKDDFIITLSPGVSVKYPFEDNLFKFDYNAEVSQFMDYTSQDGTNHYVKGELELGFSDLTFNIYDDFRHLYERPSTEDTTRLKRDDNRAGITAKLEKERLGVQLGYEFFTRDYKAEDYEAFDRKEHLYSLMLTHQTFPKTKLLAEYDFAQIRYDESTHSDSDYHQFLVGAIGELTPKTTATVKTGYQTRDYEVESNPDFNTGVLYADITHKFSDKDAIKVSFERTAEESTYSTNNYYKVASVSSTFDHYFSNKLLGFVTGAHQINSYPRETTEGSETKKRKDKYSSLGAGLKYYMREWLTFTLRADHIFRDSNFDVYEYDQNLITFTTRAEF